MCSVRLGVEPEEGHRVSHPLSIRTTTLLEPHEANKCPIAFANHGVSRE